MINKQRITALEAASKRVNAPSETEYNAASERVAERVRARIEASLAGSDYMATPETIQQSEADDALIQAYDKAHGIPEDTGAYERIEHKLEIISRRLGGEV